MTLLTNFVFETPAEGFVQRRDHRTCGAERRRSDAKKFRCIDLLAIKSCGLLGNSFI